MPISVLMKDWERGARYAGSKDRAFVRGLCLDVLRRWRSFRGEESARIATFLTLKDVWKWDESRIVEAFSGEHSDGPLTEEELASQSSNALDLPAFLEGIEGAAEISLSMAARAPVDLRTNTLKADRDKALGALKTLRAGPSPYSPVGIRIPASPAADKGPGVTVIPAFGKGWVEVQDEGSQLTVLAAGDLKGAQVLDFCAGGGGKTLALAAAMNNSGQVHAYDVDARRLAPIHERLRRAGARNVQVVAPSEPDRLEALTEKMELVFVDAPCSGSGTWRRHPDTKWRLTEEHLQLRMGEQDEVLDQAARYVKPGGTLLFVTCSFLREENDDRVSAFLTRNEAFDMAGPLDGLSEQAQEILSPFADEKALRLAPWTSESDAFTLIRLRRNDH